jgi:hypothetical protein
MKRREEKPHAKTQRRGENAEEVSRKAAKTQRRREKKKE